MPAPPSNNIKKEKEPTKKSGSLSDGSVCDVPPVSVPAVKRNQNRNGRQNFLIPHYKSGVPQRKRHVSSGEREQTGSSGYETGPKRARHENSESPVFHPYKNPVMENMVTSTNDVVYKFNGSTPAESFQVTYTIEERVKAAAFAIAYNNCKISTERFESVFDKPAPDFKTIFSWRQRLLTNGCLIDNHSSVMKPTVDKCLHCSCDVISNATQQNENKSNKNTVVTKLPNPDEIPIVSDSEDGEVCLKIDTQKRVSPDLRSVSVETLVLSGVERGNNAAVSSPGSLRSGARSHSASTQSSHSSSSASPSSKSAESDYEDNKSRTSSNKTQILPCRLTTPNTESDSVSYNSDDNNFLCRKFPEGRKVRRKIKKRVATIVSENPSNYVLNEIKKHNEVPKANIDKKINEVRQSNQPEFTGYSTTKLIDKPPLATGNIYTQNLRNMNVKPPNMLPDMEGCSSSEYVPTKFGATAKRNYQQFKDNVRRKGFWAKGNGTTLGPKRNTISSDTSSGYKQEKLNTDSARGLYSTTYNYSALQQTVQNDLDFTKDDIAGSAVEANVLPFDRPLLPKPLVQPPHPLVQPPHPLVQPPHPNDGVLRQRMPVKLPLPKNSVMNPPLPKDPPPLPKDPAPTLKDSPPLSHTNQSQPPIPKEHGFFKKSVIKKSTLPYINPVTLEVQPPLPKEPSLIVQQKCGPVNISLAKQDCIHLPLLEKQPLSHLPNDMQQQVIPLSPKNNLFIPSENRSMSLESNASIFEAVQSKSINKNRSLMDIFNEDEQTPKIPEGNDTLQNYNDTRKKYETEWNGDDDALYGDFEANEDSLSPLSMRSKQNSGDKPSANINVLDLLTEKKNLLMGLLEDFQIKPIGESEVEQGHSEPANSQTSEESLYASDSRHFANIDLSMIPEPDPMPEDISDEVIRMSHGSPVRPLNESTPNSITHKNIDPSKRVQVLESVTIHPSDSKKELSKKGFPKCKIISKTVLKPVSTIGKSIVTPKEDATLCDEEVETPAECSEPVKCFEQAQLTPQAPASQLDLSNLLSGINTNTLLLALQNLHQLSQNSLNSSVTSNQNEQDPKEQAAEDEVKPVETINLTNDEEWEKESYKEGSIERQLEQMDGDPSATPCLSDIFDPSPVKIPLNKATKLNINLEVPEELSVQQIPHLNENAPVIGNFKSFALPKPLILNRLKLAVKSNEKTKKSTNGKKRKKKVGIRKCRTWSSIFIRSLDLQETLILINEIALAACLTSVHYMVHVCMMGRK